MHVIAVEPAEDVARAMLKALIDCVCLAFIGFRNADVQFRCVTTQNDLGMIR